MFIARFSHYNKTVEPLKILFIINPVSGGKTKTNWEQAIGEYFKDLPHSIHFYLLTGKNDAESIDYWLKLIHPQKVVAVGGDGTVSLLAKQLLGTSYALGILPAGSANGMAAELNIPINIHDSLAIVLNGKTRASDVICINDQYLCLHLSDLGLNAQLVKYFAENESRGWWGYAKMLLKVALRKKRMKVTIESEGQKQHRIAFMVVIANASKYGTGATINPDGNIHDGLLEIVIIRRLSIIELIKMLFHVKRLNPKKVEVIQARNAMVTTNVDIDFQVDGEYIGKVNKIQAEVDLKKLNLILPP
jgi:diacylglycerol kinase (ATP)